MFLFRQNYTSNSSKNKKGKMKLKQVKRQNIHAAQTRNARWKQDSTSGSCVVYWRFPPQLQQNTTKEGKQISFWCTLITIQPVNSIATIQCNLLIISMQPFDYFLENRFKLCLKIVRYGKSVVNMQSYHAHRSREGLQRRKLRRTSAF